MSLQDALEVGLIVYHYTVLIHLCVSKYFVFFMCNHNCALGASTTNLLIAITVASVPGFVRILRATVIAMTSQEYIEAAKVAGSTHLEIICNHVLPDAIGMIIVQATMSIADMIIFASGLSFLGLGVQPPRPEWGIMLSDAKSYMREYPHLVIFPGLSIALCSLSLNLFGDGLRDMFDPRSAIH
ncbi:MAG: ABC transporter permease [Faecalimonas umbilicata]